jgi:MFS family permease
MTSVSFDTAGGLLRHRPFLYYFCGRGLARFASQVTAVAVGWQVYALTGSAFDLGMVGLAQFAPTALLTFIAGHTADRYNRQRVVQVCQTLDGLAAAYLALGTYGGWLNVPEIYAIVGVLGVCGAFDSPASAALLPGVTPEGMLQKGAALATGAMQVASIGGPALGGVLYAILPSLAYTVPAVFWVSASLFNAAIRLDRPVEAKPPPTLASLFDGVRFVRKNESILGTISLDLFAVLFGGATALLPIYARDILHTGPWGLGVLRGAPAVGALLTAGFLARQAIKARVGMRMFQSIIVFGAATVGFALSHWLWLSMLMLAIAGAADTVSMVIRVSLVQIATPDDMRGRVGAVNFLFINASNQLGEFESGITAAMFGAVAAGVIGGLASIAIALLWMRLFPKLRDFEKLE